MNVSSPLYKDISCKRAGIVLIEELKEYYRNGFGLGLDLLEPIEEEIIEIYKCPKSKYKFFYPENLAGDASYYKELESRNQNYYNTDSWEFYKALELIREDEKLLEIGSGNLSFLRLAKKKGVKVLVGLELNDKAVSAGTKEGLEMYNELIQDFSKTHSEVFDVVCSFQVLEHVSNVDDFITSSLKSLKKGGRLIFAVPNNEAIFFKQRKLIKYYSTKANYKLHCTTLALNSPPHHMGLWDKKSLKSLTAKYPIKMHSIHKEPIANFRISLVKDILISRMSKFCGIKVARYFGKYFLKGKLLKLFFKGDSILVEFEKE